MTWSLRSAIRPSSRSSGASARDAVLMAVPEVVVPVRGIGRNLDNDSPNYEFVPGLLLVVALAYDSLTGPDAVRDAGEYSAPISPGCCRDCHELALEQVELAEDRPGGAPYRCTGAVWSAKRANRGRDDGGDRVRMGDQCQVRS